jgi:LPS sulfotransferase NodH
MSPDETTRRRLGEEIAWRAWFAANDIEPLVVRFEDLVAGGVETTCAVFGYLGLASERIAIAARTVKTSDHVQADWLDRYRG